MFVDCPSEIYLEGRYQRCDIPRKPAHFVNTFPIIFNGIESWDSERYRAYCQQSRRVVNGRRFSTPSMNWKTFERIFIPKSVQPLCDVALNDFSWWNGVHNVWDFCPRFWHLHASFCSFGLIFFHWLFFVVFHLFLMKMLRTRIFFLLSKRRLRTLLPSHRTAQQNLCTYNLIQLVQYNKI